MKIELTPKSFLFLQICWRGLTPYGTPDGFRKVDILPSNKYPMGQKGLTLSECWRQMAENHTVGMLLLDADVVIDPIDMAAMYMEMRSHSDTILTAPVRLWPRSIGGKEWVWGHKKWGTGPGSWQEDRDDVDTGSFCFTYLPRSLIELCMSEGMQNWIYPNVDNNTYRVARANDIKVRVVRHGCFPKHMNY